ncbi:MAG: radical SAM protein [bacterium]
MKIVLISPRTGMYRYKTGAFSLFLRYAPLNLVTLASLVPGELKGRVEIYDESVEHIKREDISADIIGLTAITGSSLRAYAYADYFRSKGITVVMGGPHATLMPHEAKEHVDAVVIGHAYQTWPQLLRDFTHNNLKEFYYPPGCIDFSTIPHPDRRYLKNKPFISLNSIQAVFGCPNKCEFCVTPVTCRNKYEHRPIKDVCSEIKLMPGRYMTFVDPSPIENPRYAVELCQAMIPLKKRWTGLATTRLVEHEELMDVMAESGCKGLLIGFESLSQSSNNKMQKRFNNVDTYYTLVRKLHDRGIAIMGCFVHGLDEDDKDCFQRTWEFVKKASIDLPRYTICTPFPGTPFFKRLKNEGRILTENWTLYDAQHVVFRPRKMSVNELEEGHRWIWTASYQYPQIARRIFSSRCFLEFVFLANFGYRQYARSHDKFGADYMESDWKLEKSEE